MESLQGHFLIATPQMPDLRFQEKLIYICVHNDDGAMGVVVNQPLSGVTLADVFKSANLSLPGHQQMSVYAGGPVDKDAAFFLHSSDYDNTNFIQITETVYLSRDPKILTDISEGNGPSEFIFILGYAGWGKGQLENELIMDGWLSLPSDDDILFKTSDEHKWKEAAKKFGIDISLFGNVTGTA
jgi:putative transcriptional regulator